MSIYLISWRKFDRHDYDLTVRYRKWNFRKVIETYRGSCTVWRNVKTGKRASTPWEGMLSDWLSLIE